MPYTDRPHQPLAKEGTVAYLLAHAQELAAAGVFNGHTSAYVVFTYLCTHPGDNLPGHKAEQKAWDNYQPDVAYPAWDGKQIEEDTPLHRTTVVSALTWLQEERLIRIDQRRRSKKRGRITILSTCDRQELWRLNPRAHQGNPEFLGSRGNKSQEATHRAVASTQAPWLQRSLGSVWVSSLWETLSSPRSARVLPSPDGLGVRWGYGTPADSFSVVPHGLKVINPLWHRGCSRSSHCEPLAEIEPLAQF